jgi:Fe-S-cluster containining protein
MAPRFPYSGDQKLIQIVDAAFADAARRSGELLVCKKGCTQCCMGAFAIHQLDAQRMRRGLAALERRDRTKADKLRARARDTWKRLRREFPGDTATGILDESEKGQQRFATFAQDEPCPALNPADGSCDLYEARPMTCRVFGPPIRSEDGLGACELCYHGVPDEVMEAYEMVPDPDDLETGLVEKVEKGIGKRGHTIVASCLASAPDL